MKQQRTPVDVSMTLLFALRVSIPLVMIGCASEEPKPLCDPSAPSTGRVAIEQRSGAGRIARGQAVMYDNGGLYLFVDEQCNYWVSSPSRNWSETHVGVLDVETAAQLGERLRFGAWDEVSGVWSDPGGGVFDAPVLVFDDATRAVVCLDLCDASGVPAAVKTMRDAYGQVIHELWDRGSAAMSGVRAIAVAAEPGPNVPFVDWPLARPISDFVRTDPSIGFGEGTLEDDAASAQALKELRASFVRGDHGAFFWNTLPVTSNGSYYHLYVRDTLPFEDARGLVPLSIAIDGP